MHGVTNSPKVMLIVCLVGVFFVYKVICVLCVQ